MITNKLRKNPPFDLVSYECTFYKEGTQIWQVSSSPGNLENPQKYTRIIMNVHNLYIDKP